MLWFRETINENKMDDIYISLFSFLIIPTIVIFVAPWQIVWRLFIALLILICAGWIWWPPSKDGFGEALILGFLFIVFFVLLLLFAIRAGFYFIWGKNNPRRISTFILHRFDLCLIIAFGLICGLEVFILFGRMLSTARHGFLIHTVFTILAFCSVFALIRTMWRKRGKEGYQETDALFLSYCAGVLFSVGTLSFLGTLYPWYVIDKARDTAQNDPYCIILEKRKRTATAWEDFTFLTMDKANSRLTNHITLVILRDGRQKFYHWSYRLGQFYKDRYSTYNYHCDPIPQFANIFARFSPQDLADDKIRIIVGTMRFDIPRKFNPKVSGGSLYIAAGVPDFHPDAHIRRGLRPSLDIRDQAWINGLKDTYEGIPLSGREGSFDKYIAKNGVFYVQQDQDGSILVHISCPLKDNQRYPCHHRFYRDGGMYSFEYEKPYLPEAEAMQERLFKLFESFKK